MAVVYITGAETGLSSANGAATPGAGLVLGSPAQSNASVVTSPVKNGTYAHRINNPGASTIGVRCWYNPNAGGVVNGGFWMRLASLPAADRTLWIVQGTTTGNFHLDFDQGTGKLAAGDDILGQIGIWTSCPVLSATTWYWIAWKCDRTNDKVSLTITPDGGSATDCGDITGSNWTANNGYIGAGSDVAQGAFDCAYDDVVICTGGTEYPLAPQEVQWQTVASDGTHSFTAGDFTYGDAGGNVSTSATDVNTMLDDALPWTATRSTTDNIRQAVIRTAGYCEVVTAATASGKSNATAVRAWLAYSSTGTTANSGKCEVRNSAGTAAEVWGIFPSTTRDYSESSNFFKGVMVTDPGGWTKTELDQISFRFGGSGDVTPFPTWQALGIEIAYPPDPAAGGSLIWSPTPSPTAYLR